MNTELFKADEFKKYLVKDAGLQENTATSYISYIKAIDRDLISKTPYKGIIADLKDNLASCPSKTLALLQSIQETVEETKRIKDETFMSTKELNNGCSALKQYLKFLRKQYSDKVNTEEVSVADEELDKEVEEIETMTESGNVTIKTKEDLRKAFILRLSTQDRPAQFSIKLIAGIFKKQKDENGVIENSIRTFYPRFKSFADFVDTWVSEVFDTIKVLSKDDEFFMRDVNAFELWPQANTVNVIMDSGYKFTLYTHKNQNSSDRIPMSEGMRAMILKKITLEHTPTMLSILQDNSERLQGIKKMADLMQKEMKENNITVQPWDKAIKKLRQLISFEDIKDYADDIVRDLLFIKEKGHIELMGDLFNTNPGNKR